MIRITVTNPGRKSKFVHESEQTLQEYLKEKIELSERYNIDYKLLDNGIINLENRAKIIIEQL